MPLLTINQRILWKSYKIDGRWYRGVVIQIIQKKRYEEVHIQTELEGIHKTVVRPNTDDDIQIIPIKSSK